MDPFWRVVGDLVDCEAAVGKVVGAGKVGGIMERAGLSATCSVPLLSEPGWLVGASRETRAIESHVAPILAASTTA